MYRLRKKAFLLFSKIAAYFFHKVFYGLGRYGGTWMNTWWMGNRTYKSPLDLWVYQEIVFEKKPDIIIETGTAFGGSALYLANIMDIIGHGELISIDTEKNDVPNHDRITYLNGSSVDNSILEIINKSIIKKKVMVILDSDHSKKHVLEELKIYSNIVSTGQFLIVEDTNIGGHPVHKKSGPGPWEAVRDFLEQDSRFQIDRSKEKYLFSFNPKGFLYKVKQ